MKVAGNILPGAQEANREICAEHEVPKFSPARFFVEVRERHIADGQGRERAHLPQEQTHVIRGVQNEMHLWIGQLRQTAGEFVHRGSIGGIHAGKVDEQNARTARGPLGFLRARDGHSQNLAVDAQGFRRVRQMTVQAPDFGRSVLQKDGLREPLAKILTILILEIQNWLWKI